MLACLLAWVGQVQKLVNNWLVVTSFSIGVADTVADTETIMTIGGIIDTAKRYDVLVVSRWSAAISPNAVSKYGIDVQLGKVSLSRRSHGVCV